MPENEVLKRVKKLENREVEEPDFEVFVREIDEKQ